MAIFYFKKIALRLGSRLADICIKCVHRAYKDVFNVEYVTYCTLLKKVSV